MDAPGGWSADRRAIDVALAEGPASADHLLAALALLAGLRADLAETEERLIGLGREHHTSWQRIANALGLRSRQAAEQRWLRLRAAAAHDHLQIERARHRRQQILDRAGGTVTADLRSRASALHVYLARRPDWGAYEAAAGLARRTLAAATDAPPGALYDLARLAVRDLGTIPPRVLGPQTAAALARVATLAEQRPT
jgi:hypothetical protein